MSDFFLIAAGILLLNVALGTWQLVRGPRAADRMVTAALFGTAGVGALVLLAEATVSPALLDVALVLVILAAVAAMVFVVRGDQRALR